MTTPNGRTRLSELMAQYQQMLAEERYHQTQANRFLLVAFVQVGLLLVSIANMIIGGNLSLPILVVQAPIFILLGVMIFGQLRHRRHCLVRRRRDD